MNATIVETETAPACAVSPRPDSGDWTESIQSLDRSLAELRTGRRLEQVAASIETFLLSQVARIEESLELCQTSVGQNQIVQRILADFEKQKVEWEEQRQSESRRLYEAGERLIRGWEQLETDRQEWLAKQEAENISAKLGK